MIVLQNMSKKNERENMVPLFRELWFTVARAQEQWEEGVHEDVSRAWQPIFVIRRDPTPPVDFSKMFMQHGCCSRKEEWELCRD